MQLMRQCMEHIVLNLRQKARGLRLKHFEDDDYNKYLSDLHRHNKLINNMAKKTKRVNKKQANNLMATTEHQQSQTSQGFCHFENDVLVLNILGTPSAKRTVIGKPKGEQLKISVTAAPNNGKATDYMVTFLAREFGVKSSQIKVVFGQMNINKQLRIKAPKKFPAVISEFLGL